MGKEIALAERFTIEGLKAYHDQKGEALKNKLVSREDVERFLQRIEYERDDEEMTEPNVPTMITVEAAAKLTGLPAYLIRKLCYEERIVHLRVGDKGTKVFINRDKLLDYLNSNTGSTERRKDDDYER